MANPTDPYELLHFNMVRAHETFKLGYENILPRLDNPPTDDIKNFLGYCEAWADSIDDHHSAEEAVVFPYLNTKLDFSHEIEQHKAIHAGIDELLGYIRTSSVDPKKFDATTMKTMMQKLRDPLYQHLDEEVEHILPENLKVFDVNGMQELNAKLEKHAKSNGNPFMVVPYMRSHTPPEYKNTWPAMPWFLRKIIIPYMLASRHSGYWKYSPYSVS